MKYASGWLACLLIALTACAGESPTAPVASSSNAAACEEPDFSSFWSRFVEDQEFQRRATRSPLQKLVVDAAADPEPKPIESAVTVSAADFPLVPSFAQIRAEGLTLERVETDRGMKVRLQKPDTDYLIDYLFERDPCWMLVRIENWSL